MIKTALETKAWQLGRGSDMEQQLRRTGAIRSTGPGQYELFSQEAQGAAGEQALAGDYFKVDGSGFPYPIRRETFEAGHVHLGGDSYRQIPKPLYAWQLGDPRDEIIDFLLRHKDLQIAPDRPDACFRAPLWGSVLTADADAVLVVYRTERDADGRLLDAEFNFVARWEFDRTYRFLEKP